MDRVISVIWCGDGDVWVVDDDDVVTILSQDLLSGFEMVLNSCGLVLDSDLLSSSSNGVGF